MSDLDEELLDLADEILRYLQNHPNAVDTVEGIAKWWVWRQRITELVNRVQLALDYLVEQRSLITREVAGKVVYSCVVADHDNGNRGNEQ